MDFELNILGTGSAIPSFGRFSSAQILTTHNKSFLIDCADGTQYQMRSRGIKNNRMGHFFISHLHGDHCFGLIALISTMGMMHHTNDIYIHSHPDLQTLLQPQLDYFCNDLTFKIYFEPFDPKLHQVIYEDRSLTVETIPLVHSMPCAGFLFKEKGKEPHLDRELLGFYHVPISRIQAIKNGEDFVDSEGRIVPNSRFVKPATPAKSYAYCSDTAFAKRIIPIVEGVDVLFHEATFADSEINRTKTTLHSTARQAGIIAREAGVKQLVIGHYSARYPSIDRLLEEAREEFPNTLAAYDGMKLLF